MSLYYIINTYRNTSVELMSIQHCNSPVVADMRVLLHQGTHSDKVVSHLLQVASGIEVVQRLGRVKRKHPRLVRDECQIHLLQGFDSYRQHQQK